MSIVTRRNPFILVIVCVIREYFGILSDIGSHHYIMIYKNFQCRKKRYIKRNRRRRSCSLSGKSTFNWHGILVTRVTPVACLLWQQQLVVVVWIFCLTFLLCHSQAFSALSITAAHGDRLYTEEDIDSDTLNYMEDVCVYGGQFINAFHIISMFCVAPLNEYSMAIVVIVCWYIRCSYLLDIL